ncbi:DUF1048 domain-containing protein [Umezawaea beigongshangensis]|uniref:DUF1048 domain-containing protein n=1 Tax=Umezawaea beigongshangensis TaxID=2780383 RepID=UPI0027DB894D|nr:DUF1048 domain-containing protein [Umezawaea beigongshangensis]
MGIRDVIEGKKQWRAHVARVEALPPDYRIVCEEMQRYLFKVGPVGLTDRNLLSGVVDFFEEGVAAGRGSWNSSETTSPPSATTCSRTRAPRDSRGVTCACEFCDQEGDEEPWTRWRWHEESRGVTCAGAVREDDVSRVGSSSGRVRGSAGSDPVVPTV